MDELERVAASYLLRPRGSMCLSSGNAVDDDDDRFADDGSVYIYREGDSSPSADDPSQGYEKQQEGHTQQDRNGSNLFAPQRMDKGDRGGHENGGRHWQDERRLEPCSARTPEIGRSSSGYDWGMSGSEAHRGVSEQHTGSGSTALQHGGWGGDVAAGVANKESKQQTTNLRAWQQQEQQRLVGGPPGGEDLANRKHMSSGGGDQQAQPRFGRACEPLAATLEERRKNNNRNLLPGRMFAGGAAAEAFAVPVPGASYSAKIDRGLQGLGGRGTTIARGLGEDDAGALTQPSTKVRETAARLRNMILDRQASANRSIREIFGHFDRRRCGYVNVAEMRDALADLRLSLCPEEEKVSELQTTVLKSGSRGRPKVLL